MFRPSKARRLPTRSALIASATLAMAVPALAVTSAAPQAGATARPRPAGVLASAGVHPNRVGELDCYGFSPIQKPVKLGMTCAEPRGPHGSRYSDNGHYVGHDEPSLRFLSSQPGSGNNISMTETLPTDPTAQPTVRHPGHDVTHWFELTRAPWLSMTVCDPESQPLLPCTPRSDANAPHGKYPGAGGSFVELQFLPPGFAPFVDSLGCDNAHWCSGLFIQGQECTANERHCNFNCPSPLNFSFIQTNGVPAGPPGPQKADLATFTPNSHTLLMNPGDKITIHMWDAKIPGGRALEVRETDHTTGRSGFMITSARNGFMHTNPFTCNGTPYNFQPEYDTARPQNINPWGVGPYMINTEYEVGHFEPCTSVRHRGVFIMGKFRDIFYKRCVGPYDADTGKTFEGSDQPCFKKGDTHGGIAAPNLVTGCTVTFADLNYDGSSYWPDWPLSLTAGRFPSPFLQQQPTTRGHRYPQIQFVTDSSVTQVQAHCNVVTGQHCALPPKGAHFYPYFTLARVGGSCVWEFGNMTNGNTFGGDKQYGKVSPDSIESFVSRVRTNPRC